MFLQELTPKKTKRRVYQFLYYVAVFAAWHMSFYPFAAAPKTYKFNPKPTYYLPSLLSQNTEGALGDRTTIINKATGNAKQIEGISNENRKVSIGSSTQPIEAKRVIQKSQKPFNTLVTSPKKEEIVYKDFANGIFTSDSLTGYIGVSSDKPIDSPEDNVFNILIPHKINPKSIVTLSYDVLGVENIEGVSRSINENFATGGYIVKKGKNWIQHRESLNPIWIKPGDNIIKFSIPKEGGYSYQVKNVKLKIENSIAIEDKIIVEQEIRYSKNERVYIKGFINEIVSNNSKVSINLTELQLYPNGEFEGFYTLNETDKLIKTLPLVYQNKEQSYTQLINISEHLLNADFTLPISKVSNVAKSNVDKHASVVSLEGASIEIPQEALNSPEEISITHLRPVDIPPLDAGMVNVTKGKSAYRFLPHGTQFKKEATIKIAYDKELLPPGYSEKDIKTYFFNEKTKHWEALPLDSIHTNEQLVASKTTHFTDMINGVIQVPESPQTNAFTPTMMNDIKAAAPLAGVNLMQPPSANQKGTANVSYPFKLPAGRNGMQPQLALQYSNEGGSSYVGYGWSLSMPAITLDTRWGTPTFDKTVESEIYLLNGEQLSYPFEGDRTESYMPNRHKVTDTGFYDTTDSQLRTDEVENGVKYFTPRKKGSFAKIERIVTLGEDLETSRYIWKVTDENGTTSYYGGDESGLQANCFIIGNGADGNPGVVHWALYKVEDKYGNNMIYTYQLRNNLLYPATIQYTNSADSNDGKYRVVFDNRYPQLRQDVKVNGRNGVLQTDDRRLNRIFIKYDNKNIRRYELNYNTDAPFGKTLLESVTEITFNEEDGSIEEDKFTHTFEYYNDLGEDGNSFYSGEYPLEFPCNEEAEDSCPEQTNNADLDFDGVQDACDNCPNSFNPFQEDWDGNGIGDTCEQIIVPCTPEPIEFGYTNVNTYGVEFDLDPEEGNWNTIGSIIQIPINRAPSSTTSANNTKLATSNLDIVIDQNSWCFYNEYDFFYQVNPIDSNGNFGYFSLTYGSYETKTGFRVMNNYLQIYHLGGGTVVVDNYPLPNQAFALRMKGSSSNNSIKYYIGNVLITEESGFAALPATIDYNAGDSGSVNISNLQFNVCGEDCFIIHSAGLENTEEQAQKSKETLYGSNYKLGDLGSEPKYNPFQKSLAPITESIDTCNFSFPYLVMYPNLDPYDSSSGFLGSNVSKSWTLGGSLGIGIDKKIWTKNNTFSWGLNFGKSKSYSDVVQSDINGDGLVDLVKKQNGNIKYKIHRVKRYLNEVGEVVIENSYDSEWKEFKMWNGSTIKEFYFAKSESESWVNPHLTLGAPKFAANIGYSNTKTNTEAKVFLTDGNGDQLPDISFDGTVFFNRLEGDIPTFYSESKTTENMVITAGTAIEYNPQLIDSMQISFPKFETIKIWEAPKDGNIRIKNNWTENTSHKVSIETQNNGYYGFPSHNVEGQCRLFSSQNVNNTYNIINNVPTDTDDYGLECQTGIGCFENEITISGEEVCLYPYRFRLSTTLIAQIDAPECYADYPVRLRSIQLNNTILNNTYNGGSPWRFSLINGSNSQAVDQTNVALPIDTHYQINNNFYHGNIESMLGAFNNLGVPIYFANSSNCDINLNCNGYSNVFISNRQGTGTSSSIKPRNTIRFSSPLDGLTGVAKWETRRYNSPGITSHESVMEHIESLNLDWDAEQIIYPNGGHNNTFVNYYMVAGLAHNVRFTQFNRPIEQLSSSCTNHLIPQYTTIRLNTGSVFTIDENNSVESFITQFQSAYPNISVHFNEGTSTLQFSVTNGENPGILYVYDSPFPFTNISCGEDGIPVKKGQKIFFRLHGDGESNEPLDWNPEVTYTDEPYDDNLPSYKNTSSSYSESFILNSQNPNIISETSGEVTIDWENFIIDNPSDQVTLRITKQIGYNQTDASEDVTYEPEDILFEHTYLANEINGVENPGISFTLSYDENHLNNHTILRFEAFSNSNIDWENFGWRPYYQVDGNYTASNGQNTAITSINYPIIDHSVYREVKPEFYYDNPITNQLNNNTVDLYATSISNIQYNGSLLPSFNGLDDITTEESIHFVIKQNQQLIASKTYTLLINNGTYTISEGELETYGSLSSNEPIHIEVNGDGLYVVPNYIQNIEDHPSTVVLTVNSTTLARNDVNLYLKNATLYGSMYRNWGQFLYKNNTTLSEQAFFDDFGYLLNVNPYNISEEQFNALSGALTINEDDFNLDDESDPSDQIDNMSQEVLNIIGDLNTIPMLPYIGRLDQNRYVYENMPQSPMVERYIGFSIENYASKTAMRSASINQTIEEILEDPEEFPLQDNLFTGAYSINKYSFAKYKVLSGGISGGLSNFLGGNNGSSTTDTEGNTEDVSFVGNTSVGGSINKSLGSKNYDLSDYIDLNGDRYPDLVTENEVQYTNQTGGLNDTSYTHGLGKVAKTDIDSKGIAATGSYTSPAVKINVTSASSTKGRKAIAINGESTTGITGNFGKSDTSVKTMWLDINGDGLTDKLTISGSNTNFHLNKGDGNFALSNNWENIELNENESISYGGGTNIGGGFQPNDTGSNLWNGSWEIGISRGGGKSNTKKTLMDINGDGLVDFIDNTDGELKVRFNLGASFMGPEDIDAYNLNKNSKSYSQSANGGLSFSIPIPLFLTILKLPTIKIDGTPKDESLNKTLKSIMDYDGDGFPDFLWQMDDGTIIIRYSNIRRTNMLKTVTNPVGGEFTLDYEVEGNTYDQPGGKWVMKSVEINDGYSPVDGWDDFTPNSPEDKDGHDVYRKYFDYHEGRYDRREREFYGYKVVRTIDAYGFDTDAEGNEVALYNTPMGIDVYRQNVQHFENRSYYLQGMLKESLVLRDDPFTFNENTQQVEIEYDNEGWIVVPKNNVFSKSRNTYELRKPNYDVNMGHIIPMLETSIDNEYDVGGDKGLGSAFVILTQTENLVYNAQEITPLSSRQEFKYDELGRPIEFKNIAQGAEYMTQIGYHPLLDNEVFTVYNIITIPEIIKVYNGPSDSDPLARKRTVRGFDDFGNITRIVVEVGEGDEEQQAVTDMSYIQSGLSAGMLETITYPENYQGERMQLSYTYDPVIGMYPTSVSSQVLNTPNGENYMNYTSSSQYEYRYGNVLWTEDISGNRMYYDYDSFGRLTAIWSPKELPNGYTADTPPNEEPTISFEYYPLNNQGLPYAVTMHNDNLQNGDNTIDTYTFSDRIGRPIQVKKDIDLLVDEEHQITKEHMSVSGWVQYDEFGRARRTYHPTYEAKESSTNKQINEDTDVVYNSFIAKIDELDRPIGTFDPAGSQTHYNYTIVESLLKTSVEVEQQEGIYIIKHTYTDANGRTVRSLSEGGEAGDIDTNMKYDAIGQLLDVIQVGDSELVTSYQYDMGGRKIQMIHPDAGTNTYTYDTAGNLTRMQTPNLEANGGQEIVYEYQYNRPSQIIFPNLPNGEQNPNNVLYEYYDASDSGNNFGKLASQYDATGKQRFEYDNMGNMKLNERKIVSPDPEMPESYYTHKFEYDSWNRIQTIIYPDGEKVSYSYNRGGNLQTMEGDETYVKFIGYDHYEQKVYQQLGNGTENHYEYEPALRRMTGMQALASSGQAMFDNSYTFDNVGNVLSIKNSATFNEENRLGGGYHHTYVYDRLNRLIEAEGRFSGQQGDYTGNHEASYTLSMKYDNLNRILFKDQTHIRDTEEVLANTYGATYKYAEEKPHAVREIYHEQGGIESFEYDLNGNMTFHVMEYDYEGGHQVKRLRWDEANRLAAVIDEQFGRMQHYIYDANGERTIKGSGGVEEVYENGALVEGSFQMEAYKLYPSAYVVMTGEEPTHMQMTKHYYNGTEKIASKLGNGAFAFERPSRTNQETSKSNKNFDAETLRQQQLSALKSHLIGTDYEQYEIKFLSEYRKEHPEEVEALEPETKRDRAPEGDIYYYHSDHLGTATYLSDANGNPYQFFLNLPFGETMAEQRTGAYNNPYKFNAKELDEETGLYYYGARYYNPRTNIWLSVDPLAEKTMDPYGYCYNNPINLVDPTGMSAEDPIGIPTIFYDKEGKQTNEIPEQVKTMFRDEYGIDIGYNEGRLTYAGDAESSYGNNISQCARQEVKDLLNSDSKESLVFGYDLYSEEIIGIGVNPFNKNMPAQTITRYNDISYGAYAPIERTTFIDLADFNGQELKLSDKTINNYNSRAMNLGRVFEHELIGHGVYGLSDNGSPGDNVNFINTFRYDIDVGERLNYGKYFNISTSSGTSVELYPPNNLNNRRKSIGVRTTLIN